jgi:hypothetical protein
MDALFAPSFHPGTTKQNQKVEASAQYAGPPWGSGLFGHYDQISSDPFPFLFPSPPSLSSLLVRFVPITPSCLITFCFSAWSLTRSCGAASSFNLSAITRATVAVPAPFQAKQQAIRDEANRKRSEAMEGNTNALQCPVKNKKTVVEQPAPLLFSSAHKSREAKIEASQCNVGAVPTRSMLVWLKSLTNFKSGDFRLWVSASQTFRFFRENAPEKKSRKTF